MELKSKYTVIMVTHNMQQAVRISDCCAFFLMGELIEFKLDRYIIFYTTKIKRQRITLQEDLVN